MKTKTIFLWMLLALLVGGANGAWADLNFQILANDLGESATRKAIADGITSNDGNIKITFISGGSGSNVSWQSNDIKYKDKTETLTPASIKFQQGSSFKVEGLNGTKIKQVYLYGISSERPFSVGETQLTRYTDDPNWWVRYWAPTEAFDEVTISNPSTGTGSGNAYIYNIYIVYKATPTLSFANGGTGSLKIGAGASSDNYSSYLSHSGDGAIFYSLPSTNTAGATINASTGVVNVTSAGTVVVRATSAETETYNSNYAEYTLSVTKGSEPYSGNDITTQTYPHTWDFTTSSSDWTSSQTQMITTYGDWGGSGTYYYQTNTYASYPTGYAIDVIKGLRFSHHWIGLDWGYGHLWFGGGGSITIPSLATGQIITIVMDGRGDGATTVTAPNTSGSSYSVSSTGTHQEYTYTVTSSGDIVFTFDKNISIRSISVTNPTATWTYNATDADMDERRPNKGCITFDNVIGGVLPTGTVINEVPGITYTFTKGSTDLHIANVSTSGHYQGIVLMGNNTDTEAKIIISPQVHGFISLQGNFYKNCTITNTTDSKTEWTAPDHTYYEPLTEIAIPLIAGKTYELSGGAYAWELHAIAFRPAFLQPDLSAEQKTEFEATTATPKSAYPKLITVAQAGTVRFSENTWTAYLYDNNDVELNGYGDDLYVRGRVYAPAPHEDRQLNAYYLLYANVLQLSSNTPTTDATTNDVYLASLSNDKFTFTFNQSLTSHNASKVKVYKDGSTSPMSSGVTVSKSGANLEVTFSTSPTAGETYRIVVEQDAVSASTAKNAEIIRTFSITSKAEPPISMIYPTGVARVGDPIVLQTNVVDVSKGVGQQVSVDSNFPVTGTLKSEGKADITITANIVANRLVFKPEQPLDNNTVYTLYIPASNYNQVYSETTGRIPSGTTVSAGTTGVVMAVNKLESAENGGSMNERRVLKHDKSFTFKTGTSSGTAPSMTGSSPSNLQKGEIDDIDYDNANARISITFDQAVEITPYTKIYATPINGSEATTHAETFLPSDAGASLLVDPDNDHKIYWHYEADGLKHDLWTEVVIPANSIIGSGGKPNTEEFRFRFKMAKRSGTEDVPSNFYPHTWDFNKMGKTSDTESTAYVIKTYRDNPGANVNWLENGTDNGQTYYHSKNQDGYGWDQGNYIYITYDADNTNAKDVKTHVLPEFRGIRVSLAKSVNPRFEIRNITSGNADKKNLDGSDQWEFRLYGNTHYLTLSKVPRGKLYMVLSTTHLGINTPNATFESVKGGSYTLSNSNTLLSTNNGTRKVVINVEPTDGDDYQDVSFCVKDFVCQKIGVATESKQITDVGYATNARSYDVDYTLNNTFLDQEVSAYKVTGVSGSNATAVPVDYVPANAGVMLKAAGGADVSYPMFTWDYNQWSSDMESNKLVGVVDGESAAELPQKSANGKYNYILSTGRVNVKYNYEGTAGDEENQQGTYGGYVSGLAFYLVMKEGTILQNGTEYAYEKPKSNSAYLQLDSYLARQTGTGTESGARQYFPIDFGDESTSVTGIEDESRLSTADDSWISLQGVRVENPGKGLYIHKGKKIVIK